MTRYLARKLMIYAVTFWVAVTIDWAIPRFMPGDPIDRLLSRMQAQPSSEAPLRLLHEGVRLRRPGLEAVPQLLGRALPRRPRPEHRQLPDPRLRSDPGRAAVHDRPARPGLILLSFWAEQGRRARRAAEGARQHGAAARLHADRDAADVARDRVRLAVREHPRLVPGLRRLQHGAASRPGRSSSPGASSTTGSCRSWRSSSSPSAAGRSGCGT